ncbi:MAG TPA: hypothetical protein VGR07_10580 [Thermoanaerobaculia bacterium]|jgi:hypothetical protein|nr:hypothetical protein [Thermoanaerobaculia bacterium]
MLKSVKDRITSAHIIAALALFVALGGSAYAVNKIDGSDIRDRSLSSKEFKSNSVNGRIVKERSLGAVPRAQNSARLGGQPASSFFDTCPSGTKGIIGTCFELQTRPPASYRSAAFDCSLIDNRERLGRRLPTHQELMVALADPEIQLAPGGELTGNVYPSSTPGKLDVLVVTEENGNVGLVPDDGSGARPYRCVTDPMN